MERKTRGRPSSSVLWKAEQRGLISRDGRIRGDHGVYMTTREGNDR